MTDNSKRLVLLNRFLHLIGIHFCACKRIVLFKNVYGVVDNDCVICKHCWMKEIYK